MDGVNVLPQTPFSQVFLAEDDVSVRRAVNCLLRSRKQFACIPLGESRWQMSTSDEGVQTLDDNGIEVQ